jgi:hypothetical protein
LRSQIATSKKARRLRFQIDTLKNKQNLKSQFVTSSSDMSAALVAGRHKFDQEEKYYGFSPFVKGDLGGFLLCAECKKNSPSPSFTQRARERKRGSLLGV